MLKTNLLLLSSLFIIQANTLPNDNLLNENIELKQLKSTGTLDIMHSNVQSQFKDDDYINGVKKIYQNLKNKISNINITPTQNTLNSISSNVDNQIKDDDYINGIKKMYQNLKNKISNISLDSINDINTKKTTTQDLELLYQFKKKVDTKNKEQSWLKFKDKKNDVSKSYLLHKKRLNQDIFLIKNLSKEKLIFAIENEISKKFLHSKSFIKDKFVFKENLYSVFNGSSEILYTIEIKEHNKQLIIIIEITIDTFDLGIKHKILNKRVEFIKKLKQLIIKLKKEQK